MEIQEQAPQTEIANRMGATREMVNHVLQDLIRGGFMAKDVRYGLILKVLPSRRMIDSHVSNPANCS